MISTFSTISQTLKSCRLAGFKPIENKIPIQSELKKVTSLIGLAYLNYIYQNDLSNKHFCESMLFMKCQTPDDDVNNIYVQLFDIVNASKTIAILEDIQLSFDYSIDRTNVSIDKVQNSVDKINMAVRKK